MTPWGKEYERYRQNEISSYLHIHQALFHYPATSSCLSIFEAESFCARDQQQQQEKCVECDPNRFLIRGSGDLDESESAVGSSRTIVFTGTVCRADQVGSNHV